MISSKYIILVLCFLTFVDSRENVLQYFASDRLFLPVYSDFETRESGIFLNEG